MFAHSTTAKEHHPDFLLNGADDVPISLAPQGTEGLVRTYLGQSLNLALQSSNVISILGCLPWYTDSGHFSNFIAWDSDF